MTNMQVLETVFKCQGCGYQGTYPQVNGHRMGKGRLSPECAGPPVMVTRKVDQETGELIVESLDTEPTENEEGSSEYPEYNREDEETPGEGTPTIGRSQDRLPGGGSSKGPRGAFSSGPVGVPSSGAYNPQPSGVRQMVQIPAVMMQLYDWARVENGYQGRYEDFIVESVLGYWLEEVRCPTCDTIIFGFEVAVVPLSELSAGEK